jgi:zinc protease
MRIQLAVILITGEVLVVRSFCFLFFLTLSAQAEIEKPLSFSDQIHFSVEKYKLKNGLTVLLHEDHSAPLISIHQWFRVGSADEKPGRTGIAHFFEHLMFKGTTKYTNKEFDRVIQANGGTNNAFTTRDYTGYYENMPSGKLELILDIESDRLRNLVFDEKEIMKEREVVKEERRYRVENSVFGYLNETVFETVFKTHPYRWPVIGYMKDLDATSIDDLKEFYRIFYAPNNAVLVITGDFSIKSAKGLIAKYYDAIPAQPLPEKKKNREPEQKGERTARLAKDVQSPTIAIAFQGQSAGAEDSYALDLLANILGNGTSSRLHKALVYRQQIADQVAVWSDTSGQAGLVQIVSSVKPGLDADKVANSIYSELWKVRNELVSVKELEKAKTQIMKDYVDSLKTVGGKARILALNEIFFEDYTQLFKDLDKYSAVTVNQIKAVAEKYLKPEQRSVIRVNPKGLEAKGV